MNHILTKIVSIVGFSFLMFSCAKQWSETEVKSDKLPKLKERTFVKKMDSLHALRPQYFYSKMKVSFTDKERTVSFKTSVNVVLDSAVSAILSYAAIPIFTAYLDTSDISIVNKKDKCFMNKRITDYSELLGVDLSFDNIQELVFGLPIGYVPGKKYHVINKPNQYILSTHKKRDQKKSEKRNRSNIIYSYALNTRADQLHSTHIFSPLDSLKLDIQYQEWQIKGGVSYPKEMLIDVSGPNTRAQIKMIFNKLKINEPRQLFMIIPEHYETCN